MSQVARVTSIQTVEDFKAALCQFGVDAQDALCAVEVEIRRTIDWLKERQKHWQHELRKRQDDLVRAKNELTARKYQNRDGRGQGYTEQEKALKKAQERLREAEIKLEHCRRWAPQLHHAVMEYEGPARRLAGVLEADLRQAVALLENKLAALDAYVKLAPPATPSPPPGIGSSAATPVDAAAVATPAAESPAKGEQPPAAEQGQREHP
jgi:hypothetical protein